MMTVAALGVACLTGLSGVGYMAYGDLQKIKPDRLGCYSAPNPQAQTAVLVDSSEPRFDAAQSRDLKTAFRDIFQHGLGFNERIRMVTTEKNHIGSVPKPVLELCGGASNAQQLEDIGAASTTQVFLGRQRSVTFKKTVHPVLDDVFATKARAGRGQNVESPILEQIQSVSRLRGFAGSGGPRRLIVVSDLIQNTREIQFCAKKKHLPRFLKFKSKSVFAKIKPKSLQGVDVKIYMLVRPGLGKGVLKFCSEDELVGFWRTYFADAGAASTEIIRLRDGAYVASKR